MDIYHSLRDDHDTIIQLLNDLMLVPQRDDPRADAIIENIREELISHARAEEVVFYNSLRSVKRYEDLVRHGYADHVEIESLLRLLQVKGKADRDWKKTADRLKVLFEQHVAEEEGEFFEAARNAFSDQEAEDMGRVFEEIKPKIREKGLGETTLDLLGNMMPPSLSERFRKQKDVRPKL